MGNMIDYTETNEFLRHTYDLFEAIYETKQEPIMVKKKRFSKPEPTYPEVDKIYEKAKDYSRFIRTTVPSFDTLFEFGSFIKSIEKVFFYKNDSTAVVCCDSKLSDKTSRRLVFSLSDVRIVVKLDRLNRYDEYIDITISRTYGKNMETKFSIKNGEMEYIDCNDFMLINVLNYLFQNIIADLFDMVIDRVYNATILDYTNLNLSLPQSQLSYKYDTIVGRYNRDEPVNI